MFFIILITTIIPIVLLFNFISIEEKGENKIITILFLEFLLLIIFLLIDFPNFSFILTSLKDIIIEAYLLQFLFISTVIFTFLVKVVEHTYRYKEIEEDKMQLYYFDKKINITPYNAYTNLLIILSHGPILIPSIIIISTYLHVIKKKWRYLITVLISVSFLAVLFWLLGVKAIVVSNLCYRVIFVFFSVLIITFWTKKFKMTNGTFINTFIKKFLKICVFSAFFNYFIPIEYLWGSILSYLDSFLHKLYSLSHNIYNTWKLEDFIKSFNFHYKKISNNFIDSLQNNNVSINKIVNLVSVSELNSEAIKIENLNTTLKYWFIKSGINEIGKGCNEFFLQEHKVRTCNINHDSNILKYLCKLGLHNKIYYTNTIKAEALVLEKKLILSTLSEKINYDLLSMAKNLELKIMYQKSLSLQKLWEETVENTYSLKNFDLLYTNVKYKEDFNDLLYGNIIGFIDNSDTVDRGYFYEYTKNGIHYFNWLEYYKYLHDNEDSIIYSHNLLEIKDLEFHYIIDDTILTIKDSIYAPVYVKKDDSIYVISNGQLEETMPLSTVNLVDIPNMHETVRMFGINPQAVWQYSDQLIPISLYDYTMDLSDYRYYISIYSMLDHLNNFERVFAESSLNSKCKLYILNWLIQQPNSVESLISNVEKINNKSIFNDKHYDLLLNLYRCRCLTLVDNIRTMNSIYKNLAFNDKFLGNPTPENIVNPYWLTHIRDDENLDKYIIRNFGISYSLIYRCVFMHILDNLDTSFELIKSSNIEGIKADLKAYKWIFRLEPETRESYQYKSELLLNKLCASLKDLSNKRFNNIYPLGLGDAYYKTFGTRTLITNDNITKLDLIISNNEGHIPKVFNGFDISDIKYYNDKSPLGLGKSSYFFAFGIRPTINNTRLNLLYSYEQFKSEIDIHTQVYAFSNNRAHADYFLEMKITNFIHSLNSMHSNWKNTIMYNPISKPGYNLGYNPTITPFNWDLQFIGKFDTNNDYIDRINSNRLTKTLNRVIDNNYKTVVGFIPKAYNNFCFSNNFRRLCYVNNIHHINSQNDISSLLDID